MDTELEISEEMMEAQLERMVELGHAVKDENGRYSLTSEGEKEYHRMRNAFEQRFRGVGWVQ